MASLLQRSSRALERCMRPYSSSSSHFGAITSRTVLPNPSAGGSSSHQSSSSFGYVGTLCGAAALVAALQSQILSDEAYSEAGKTEKAGPLKPDKWASFTMEEKVNVTPNTSIYRFTFNEHETLGLEVASCILTRAQIGTKADGKPNYVIRPYTPISPPDARGYFDLLVKVYPEGKMSKHIGNLKPGDTLEIKGPILKIRYEPNMKKNIGMVAGGTGITPMLQIINAILSNKEDRTKVSLIFANITPKDILLKERLDALAAKHPNFKVHYVVDKPTKEWKGGSGYITKDMVLKGLPAPSKDTLIFVCGPPGMMQHISGDKAPDYSQGEVSGLLKDAGYSKEMVYKF